jgi:stage V sporulation protein S
LEKIDGILANLGFLSYCFLSQNELQFNYRNARGVRRFGLHLQKHYRRDANVDVIKVSGTARTSAVAGAIAGVVRENKRAEVQAIGASAVNQAIKALTLAKGYLASDGFDIIFTPEFVDVDIDGKVRTAIKFVVEPR